MNKTYYKGYISLLSNFYTKKTSKIGIYYNKYHPTIDEEYKAILSKTEIDKIKVTISEIESSQKKDISGYFPSMIKNAYAYDFNFCRFEKKNVIFELIKDESGEYYGKELYTGLIFPVFDIKNIPIEEYLYIKNSDGTHYFNVYYERDANIIHNIKMDKYEALLNDIQVADINEVNDYLELKKNKRKLKKEIEAITKLANKNVFNSEVVPLVQKEKVREKQDELTIMMENIEFLLEKLGTINKELKSKYEREYELLLSSEDELLTTNPITKTSLSRLEGEIEYAISYSNASSSDIITYLENLKKEYLDNFINNKGEKTLVTLEEIDKLNELFLKMKSLYNLKVQREVIRNISFIYLMEVYENINIITEEQLKESYFADNMKSIIIAIESLIRADLIEDNIIIDFNSELTIHELLDIISRIKFRQNIENKGITKKLEM